MAILRRDWHQIDESHGSFNTRKIGKWLNYQTPGGIFAPIDSALEDSTVAPPNWDGAYEFELEASRQPLEIRIGDNTDANNKALWGMRLAAYPSHWVNYKAVNVNTVTPVRDYSAKTVTWTGLWDNANMVLEIGRHRCDRRIVLTGVGHPATFRFALRYPAGFSHEIVDNGLKFYDAQGRQYLHAGAVSGEDAEGKRIGVSLVAAADLTVGQRTFPTYRVVPSAADLATAVYPVVIP